MTEKLMPSELSTLADVAAYWQQCLESRSTLDEKLAASHMVGVVSNANDERWSTGNNPAYGIIFELAASLETPNGSSEYREIQWRCIEALLPLLSD